MTSPASTVRSRISDDNSECRKAECQGQRQPDAPVKENHERNTKPPGIRPTAQGFVRPGHRVLTSARIISRREGRWGRGASGLLPLLGESALFPPTRPGGFIGRSGGHPLKPLAERASPSLHSPKRPPWSAALLALRRLRFWDAFAEADGRAHDAVQRVVVAVEAEHGADDPLSPGRCSGLLCAAAFRAAARRQLVGDLVDGRL